MRPVNAPVRKTVIAVTAVAALSGAGIAAPAIVSAATDDRPTGRTVVDVADDQVRKEQGRHHREPGDDRSNDASETDDSGFDSPHDRAERTRPNGRHLEPGDDRSNDVNETDDSGFDSPHDRAERTSPTAATWSRATTTATTRSPEMTAAAMDPMTPVSDGSGHDDDSSGHGGGDDDSSGHGGGDD